MSSGLPLRHFARFGERNPSTINHSLFGRCLLSKCACFHRCFNLALNPVITDLLDDAAYAPYGTMSLLKLFFKFTKSRNSRVIAAICSVMATPRSDPALTTEARAAAIHHLRKFVGYNLATVTNPSEQLPAVLACAENCLRCDSASLARETLLLVPQFFAAFPIADVHVMECSYRLIARALVSPSIALRAEALFAWSQALIELAIALAAAPRPDIQQFISGTIKTVVFAALDRYCGFCRGASD
jgi:hypothetical protein